MNTLSVSVLSEATSLEQVNNRRAYVTRVERSEVPTFAVEVGSRTSPKLVMVLAIATVFVIGCVTAYALRGGIAWDTNASIAAVKAFFAR